MSLTLYGIDNCDTVRKARRWLEQQGKSYRFHDLRADGLDAETLRSWLAQVGWERVVNRRSTSWKALDPKARDGMDNQRAATAILSAPTLVKRPVLVDDTLLEFGFSESRYRALLG